MNREERRALMGSAPRRVAVSRGRSVVFDVLDARAPGGLAGGRRVWYVENPRTYGVGFDLGVVLHPVSAYDAGRFDSEVEGSEIVAVDTLADLPAAYSWFDPFSERVEV